VKGTIEDIRSCSLDFNAGACLKAAALTVATWKLGTVFRDVIRARRGMEAGAAADTAAEVGEGAARSPSFIVKPNGETVIVPNSAEGPFPVESGMGFMFRGGSGGHGLSDAASDVRIMDPVTGGKYPKPNGYASYLNGGGQTINPFTGQTVGKADSWWHWVFGP
jgi:hypothetical protein